MGLRFDPMGGGQFKAAIQAIAEAERQPVRNLENRKQIEEAKVKLFGEFKSKFNTLQSALTEVGTFNQLRELKVDLGDGKGMMDVTVDKTKAQPGTYQIEIEELAARSSMISNSFEDPDEKILGVGFVTIEGPDGNDLEIYIDSSNSSLRGVAALINAEAKSPVRASVIKDATDPDEPWRLVLAAKDDGSGKEVDFPNFYFLDGKKQLFADDSNDAQNGLIKVDGFEVETDGNSVADFFQGVNIHLKEARPGRPFTLTISEDTEKITGKIKNVVDGINGVLEFINKQNAVDEKSNTRATFTGDTGLQSIEYRLRNLLHEGYSAGPSPESGQIAHLNEFGISLGRDGKIRFEESKFKNAMDTDFERVANAISGEMGFVTQLSQVLKGYARPGEGLIALRERTLQSRIRQIDDNIENKERLIDRKIQNLTEKFSRLQSVLSGMQQQQAYVQATLGGAGGSMVQQLLGG